ncbi:MAG: transcriptional regulator GcvA [Colwellia sp.]|nr:transcriptional regulator GcvA [Colwellia sp.]
MIGKLKKFGNNKLPPLSALRGFEAAARLNSFSKASEELCMTQSAISHQVKLLEEYFGQPLFKRVNRTVEVTDAGVDFLKTTQLTLNQLYHGSLRLGFFDNPELVVLTTLSSFASKWLMKRLPDFKKQHPNLNLWIYTNENQEPLENAEVDLAIWQGDGEWSGVEVIKLFDDFLTPLYSPKLLAQGEKIECPEDLANYPLVHVEQALRRTDWALWFDQQNLSELVTISGYNFNDASLAIDCAVAGQGVILGSVILAEDKIASGELIRPFDSQIESDISYYLVYKAEKVKSLNIKLLWQWLLDEAKISSNIQTSAQP